MSTAMLLLEGLEDSSDLVLELEEELNGGSETTGTKTKVIELVVELRQVKEMLGEVIKRLEKSDESNAKRDEALELRIREAEMKIVLAEERANTALASIRAKERMALAGGGLGGLAAVVEIIRLVLGAIGS